jgi:hypothetical protein
MRHFRLARKSHINSSSTLAAMAKGAVMLNKARYFWLSGETKDAAMQQASHKAASKVTSKAMLPIARRKKLGFKENSSLV